MKVTYLLLRAVPDSVRGEALNVGIIVFANDDVSVHVSSEGWRLRALHPNLGELDLDEWADDLQVELSLLPSEEARVFMACAIKGAIQAPDEPCLIFVNDQAELSSRVSHLMSRLVSVPSRAFKTESQPHVIHRSKLQNQLKAWFRTSKVYSSKVSDLSRGKIVPNFPIVADSDLYADFALKNGAVHVIETLDLRGIDRPNKTLRGEAGFKSVLLDQARQVLSSEARRIAVVSADNYSAVRPLIAMVERYSDDLIYMESSEDRQRLANFVSTCLHVDTISITDSVQWTVTEDSTQQALPS